MGERGGREHVICAQIRNQSLYNIRETAEMEAHYCERNKSENEFLPLGRKEQLHSRKTEPVSRAKGRM